MPMIYVDGQEIVVKQGENILEACLNAGLDLPIFAGIQPWVLSALAVNAHWSNTRTRKIPEAE